MEPLIDARDIDRDGIWHIGRGSRGCRHCGKVEVHYAANGKAAWHHPGTSCCVGAIKNQLTWRRDDLQRYRNEAAQARREVDELHQKAERAIGREAAEARALAERAERGYQAKVQAWRRLTDGDPTLEIVGIKNEIADLERHLAELGVGAA
jgi:hypothetical protein